MYNKKEAILKKAKNLSLIYILLISIFVITMAISYALPNKNIIKNTKESMPKLLEEGLYPKVFFDSHKSQLDNFTDSWMLNIAISADNKHPLKSSLANPYKESKDAKDKIEQLNKSLNEKDLLEGEYSRYWHGYQIVLRPLLLIFNYEQIRYINMFGLMSLFMIVAYLIKKEIGTRYVISFLVSMLMIMFMISPMSLQFSSMFYMTFISMIVVIIYHKQIKKNNYLIYIFFIIGALTSFVDLLTVPLLTLGFPLITYILLQEKNNNLLTNTIETIKSSIIWAIGYGTTWATKWIIATIVLKKNIIKNALSQILSRTSHEAENIHLHKIDVIKKNTDLIFDVFIIKLFIIALIVWLILFIISKRKNIINILPILLISIYPILWYVVLENHSYMHFWFTYRSLGVSIFAVTSFMMYSIDIYKLKNKLGGRRWNI